jgi:hypothetical protein
MKATVVECRRIERVRVRVIVRAYNEHLSKQQLGTNNHLRIVELTDHMDYSPRQKLQDDL